MKIFCTGASGYIGGSVAAHLIAAGHQVTGLVRSPEKAEAVRARGIQPVLGTLDDGKILTQAAQAADIAKEALTRPVDDLVFVDEFEDFAAARRGLADGDSGMMD